MTGVDSKRRASPFLRQLLAVSGVVMYMIGTGANIAYPGVLILQLRQPGSAVTLTTEHESWIASILGLALISGMLVAPVCLQRLGRRLTNQLSTLPALAGWALVVAAKGPEVLLASRSLLGFAMGIQAASAPISIAEYSSPKHRGAFLTTIAFSFATGILMAHVFGTLLYWRTAAIACGSCYILSLILTTLSPETPPYLASKGLTSKCRKSFRWLRDNDPNSEKELAVLLNSQKVQIVSNKKVQEPWFKKLAVMVRRPEFYKPTLIMMFMFIMFQVSGMTVIPSYISVIMDEVTARSIDANISMLTVDVVRFVSAVIACIIVNRYPRRFVLFLGICICVSALLVTSLMLYLREEGFITEAFKWTPVIPCLIYIFGQTIGILPIPWAIAGEIFPLAYRSLGSGISGMFLSLMFFLVVKTAPATFEAIGVNGTFCIYGIAVAICGVFLYFLLPETRGKTLYEIECHFRGIQPEDLPDVEEEGKMLELQKVEGR